MLLADLVQWWYFKGWGIFVQNLRQKLKDTADFFSIGQLLRTLLMPYRQISANSTSDTSGSRLNAFFDRLISRLVGFFTRTFIIIFGSLAMLLEIIFGALLIVLWPCAPLLIIAGVVTSVMGVTLWAYQIPLLRLKVLIIILCVRAKHASAKNSARSLFSSCLDSSVSPSSFLAFICS